MIIFDKHKPTQKKWKQSHQHFGQGGGGLLTSGSGRHPLQLLTTQLCRWWIQLAGGKARGGTVIQFMHHSDSPWESEDQDSDTSTPDCKQGRHAEVPSDQGREDAHVGNSPGHDCHKRQRTDKTRRRSDDVINSLTSTTADAITKRAIREILQEGVNAPIPRWIQTRGTRGPSIMVLADALLNLWPGKDTICTVHVCDQWPLKRWAQAIRAGDLLIQGHTVVLYLENTHSWQDVPPI